MTTAHEAEVAKMFATAAKVAKILDEEDVDPAMGITAMTFMISSAIALVATHDQAAADALQAAVIDTIVNGRVAVEPSISDFVASQQEAA